jgi:hypothetical protein
VALVQAWQPPGGQKPLGKGTRGVLIRVETAEVARVDFARSGLHDVPIAATDLLANANRIRRGELAKSEPNFLQAVGTRLVDPASGTPTAFAPERALAQRAFLCVFADPSAEGFADLARGLAPQRERSGMLTILFPQTDHGDSEVAATLQALGWTAPFVTGRLSELYTRTLLPAQATLPALLLQTGEGRLLFASPWKEGVASELKAALDQALPERPSGAIGAAPAGKPTGASQP